MKWPTSVVLVTDDWQNAEQQTQFSFLSYIYIFRDCQMILLCWLIALAICFLSIGICFVIEPMHARSPHRQSPIMMAAVARSTENSNPPHSSSPMEMSRRGFLMSSLAAIAFLPSSVLAANRPPEVSDTLSDIPDLKRHNNSTHTSSRRSGGGARSRAAGSKRYYDHDTHHEEENHKDGRKSRNVKQVKATTAPAEVKPIDGKSKGKTAPPRIKGLASRGELFLKITDVLV